MTNKNKYTATRQDGRVIYTKTAWKNLWGHLPLGFQPVEFAKGDDPWDGAVFKSHETGNVITIKKDELARDKK